MVSGTSNACTDLERQTDLDIKQTGLQTEQCPHTPEFSVVSTMKWVTVLCLCGFILALTAKPLKVCLEPGSETLKPGCITPVSRDEIGNSTSQLNNTEERRLNETTEMLGASESMTEQTTQLPKTTTTTKATTTTTTTTAKLRTTTDFVWHPFFRSVTGVFAPKSEKEEGTTV